LIGEIPVNPNFLIFAPDDLGREYLKAYAKLPANLQVHTPNIDKLAQEGVTFTRAYSQPWCSPTRASWLTGRHPFQTGIGSLAEGANQPLLSSEVCLPKALKLATDNLYTTAGFVKWHLSDWCSRGGAYQSPVRVGFDHYEGHIRNLDTGETYESFEAFSADPAPDGSTVVTSRYHVGEWAPKYFADRAVEWIGEQEQPWLCYFAINLPHSPYNRPPEYAYDTDTYDLPEYAPANTSDSTVPTFFKAMLQGLDWTLGYILSQMSQADRANTVVLFWSDNGTASASFDTPGTTGVDLAPYLGANYDNKAKRTVFELGCNIPLIISGPGVYAPGSTNASLVSSADMFRTIIELAGGTYADVPFPPNGTRSSISFATSVSAGATSARTYALLELFGPNGPNIDCTTSGSRALSYARFKLMRSNTTGTTGFPAGTAGTPNSTDAFYDLLNDPNEITNLIGTGPINLTGDTLTAYNLAVADYATAFSTL